MSRKKEQPPSKSARHFPFITIAFIMCALYWTFLASTAQMIIADDAITYEELGNLLQHKGWLAYLQTGPNREPVYPFLIAIAMTIADRLNVSYQSVQILLQISLLFLTQLLSLRILERLNVNPFLHAITVLYLGLSPGLINSTFCLFSEIATYPQVLIIVLLSVRAWQSVLSQNRQRIIQSGVLLGAALFLLTMTKAAFEIITPLLLLPFLFYGIRSLIKKEKTSFKSSAIFLLITLLTFYVPVNAYKLANKIYNGQYVLTDRGSWALYGNTARRMEPLTEKRFLAALAFVPSWQFCVDRFGQEDCQFWSFIKSDEVGAAKRNEFFYQGWPKAKINRTLIELSVQKALSNPFQYVLLCGVEGLKMFFWDAVMMQYVIFPELVYKLYGNKTLNVIFSFIIAILSAASLIYVAGSLLLKRRKIALNPLMENEKMLLLNSMTAFIFSYIVVYSLFYILPRYSLTLGPLYMILLSFCIQQSLKSRKASS